MVLCNVPYNAPNVKACLCLLSPEISVYALTKKKFGAFENLYKKLNMAHLHNREK